MTTRTNTRAARPHSPTEHERSGSVVHRRRTSPPGFALVITLISLLVVSVVVAALSHQALGVSQRARTQRLKLTVAQTANAAALEVGRTWQPTNDSLVIGVPQLRRTTLGTLQLSVFSTRTSPYHWLVTAHAQDGDSAAGTLTRAASQLFYRLRLANIPLVAALTTRDSISVSGAARVSGTDTTVAPIPSALCTAPADVAAIAAPDTTRVCDGACGASGPRIHGAPPLLTDPNAANPALYDTFGNESWATLTARATITLPHATVITPAPTMVGAACDTSNTMNWGSPSVTGPCQAHSPLIHALGDIEIRGGEGQGVLIAEGDVTFTLGGRFYGVVLSRDDLVMRPPAGGTLFGVALAGNLRGPPTDHPTIDGNSLVQFSRCAAEAALRRIAPLIPVTRRASLTMR